MLTEKEEYNKYLFYQAVENENLDLLKTLPDEYNLNTSIDINDLDYYCENKDLFTIKYINLIYGNHELLCNMLYYSSQWNSLNIIKYLVRKGVDIHRDNEQSLMLACINGSLDVVKYLVENDADIHAKEEDCFIMACRNGHLDVVKYLVSKGALKAARDN